MARCASQSVDTIALVFSCVTLPQLVCSPSNHVCSFHITADAIDEEADAVADADRALSEVSSSSSNTTPAGSRRPSFDGGHGPASKLAAPPVYIGDCIATMTASLERSSFGELGTRVVATIRT